MNKFKISKGIIYNYESDEEKYICCFLNDELDIIFELSGISKQVFKLIDENKGVDSEAEYIDILDKLLELGILTSEKAGPNLSLSNRDLKQKFTPDLEKIGITLKTYDELYSPELAAYGFTTLTATNCSSYSDSS